MFGTAELFDFQADIIRKVASTVGGQAAVFTPRDSRRGTIAAMHLPAKGLAELRKGEGAENARPFFEAAIEADPNSAFGYIGMGFYFRNTAVRARDDEAREERLKQATVMAQRALELEPNNDVAHYLMGQVHMRENELDKARVWFDKAKSLNPSFSNVYVGASTEKIYRGATGDAIDDIHHAMSIDPLHPGWFHRQLAWALWQADDCEAALESLNRMPRISAGNHKQLAIFQVCVGDVVAAQSSMKVHLEKFPDATLAEEANRHADNWTAPGQQNRWLEALRTAGMPE